MFSRITTGELFHALNQTVAQYHAQAFRIRGCRKSNDVRDWMRARGKVHNAVGSIVDTALI